MAQIVPPEATKLLAREVHNTDIEQERLIDNVQESWPQQTELGSIVRCAASANTMRMDARSLAGRITNTCERRRC